MGHLESPAGVGRAPVVGVGCPCGSREALKNLAYSTKKFSIQNSPLKICGVSGDRFSTIRKIYVSGIVERLI